MLRLSGVGFWHFWTARFIYDFIHYVAVMSVFTFLVLQPFQQVSENKFYVLFSMERNFKTLLGL